MKTPRVLRLLALLTLLVVALGALPALARPGGGNTFRAPSTPSRPSSPSTPSRPSTPSWPPTPSTPSRPSTPSWPSSPSSPDSPSYPVFALLLAGRIVLEHDGSMGPMLLLLALAGVVVLIAMVRIQSQASRRRGRPPIAWTSPARPRRQSAGVTAQSMRTYLEGLRALDPDFSLVLFEDFLYALYARVHEARGRGGLDGLAGYVSPAARRGLLEGGLLAEIKAIVVASFEITGVLGLKKKSTPDVRVAVAFTANYTEVGKDGTEQSYWVAETWEVTRRRDAISARPRTSTPSAAPTAARRSTPSRATCARTARSQSTPARATGASSPSPRRSARRAARSSPATRSSRDRISTPSSMPTPRPASASSPAAIRSSPSPRSRAGSSSIFAELQIAWSTRDWKRARPFVSDALFQSQLYWMTTYRKQKLRNVTERSRILGVQMAKLTADKFFDAITVRVFASGLDYTVSDETGEVVSGSKTRERYYTEYWTLIRGSLRTGKARAELACPNCGGPLAVIDGRELRALQRQGDPAASSTGC